VSPNGLIYATSPVLDAASAQSWTSSELRELVQTADFVLAPDGVAHVAYAVDRRGIYHVSFDTMTGAWSDPATIWLASSESYSSGSVRIERGSDGVLHVAWGMTSAKVQWNPIGVAYARSVDEGQTWRQTFESLVERENQPNIGFDQNGNVHLVWNNPAGSPQGRGHVISNDSGLTWSTIDRINVGYAGQTYWPSLIQDSAGTLHLITAADSPGVSSPRLFHSVWLGSVWSAPEIIAGQTTSGEGPSTAVSNGNLLVVAWFSYAHYGIWTSSQIIDAPRIEPQTIMEPTAPAILEEVPTPAPTPTATPLPSFGDDLDRMPGDSSRAIQFALLSGLAPVLLVIGFILLRRSPRN